MKSGWSSSVFVGSALIDFYAKLLLINDALEVFDEMPFRNSVCANALMSGYAEAELWVEGLELIRKMRMLNLNYDNFTLSAALRACAGLHAIELGEWVDSSLTASSDMKAVEFGKQLHTQVMKSGWSSSVFVGSALIDFYAKLLLINDAVEVFDEMPFRNSVCANALMSGYAEAELWVEELELIRKMRMLNLNYDNFTLSAALRACAGLHAIELGEWVDSSLTAYSDNKDVEFGKQLHTHVIKSGWSSSVFVGSALIDFYAKLLLINDAAELFDEMPFRNSVCANPLLSGSAEAELWVEGLERIKKMPMLNLNYDNFTLPAALRACAGLYAMELGGQVHAKIIRTVPDVGGDVFLQSSLIER
ncbi:hypothetical protein RHGRI_013472 [Rhododendron griersonianum]|uniref:Pentatricopeptide repeat-containing protein n=1 Tax=Rhododendron griersonianum TaxID=479676 RepID=A0AAV6K5Z0_9ERIC|nr:hypothetical protein RHGRI_013472 [Rhododendron griersonianum]